ncbi:MAG: ribosomal RNA small subunit methyltransferase A [Candidatus Moeniiplasma glomeromycotorum]|nr:ribosomal RNA small subunit methyltransferase A [Candidatus Moeniiplasma glomeromycotorum]MCE8167311.1 ribosomal RNA small subunit methyltransferase A [Candidatus Moeniiplasma glomeromycotorum]MCE8168675.1 ribosomal RNA small subunit methyltransferase A [Candidatus Moeniiplasma glomeromycotorum]
MFKIIYPPRKKLGQNFLLDKNYLQKIVEICSFDPNTIVIEIGSGYGNLTDWLIRTNCRKIISLEKDKQLFQWLVKNKSKADKVLFLHQDALKVDWLTFTEKLKTNSLVVVGNLPYYIANSLIVNLLFSSFLFKDLIFLVQKEVAQKWAASPSKYPKHYSALSVFINYLAQAEIVLIVPASSFVPAPPVDGGLVKIKPYWNVNLSREELISFLSFLKKCFHSRRKILLNNLSNFWSVEKKEWENYFQIRNYSLQIRPQNLTPPEYWELFVYWKKSSPYVNGKNRN